MRIKLFSVRNTREDLILKAEYDVRIIIDGIIIIIFIYKYKNKNTDVLAQKTEVTRSPLLKIWKRWQYTIYRINEGFILENYDCKKGESAYRSNTTNTSDGRRINK